MKIHKDNKNHNWYIAHYGTVDINPTKELICDFCLKSFGRIEEFDCYAACYMCSKCVSKNE